METPFAHMHICWEKEVEWLSLFLVSQSESSVESSPEVSRKPSVQEVSEGHSKNVYFSTRVGIQWLLDLIIDQVNDLISSSNFLIN